MDENGHPVCVKMYDRDEIGKWYTHPCDHQAQYVCEYNRIGHNNPDPPTTMDPTVSLSLSDNPLMMSARVFLDPITPCPHFTHPVTISAFRPQMCLTPLPSQCEHH